MPQECVSSRKSDHVRVDDAGQSLTIRFEIQTEHKKIKLDGCVFLQETSSDYLISTTFNDIIIELKGKDVVKALHQIEEAAKKLKPFGFCKGKVIGIISASRIPFRASKLDVEREKLLRRSKISVYATSSNRFAIIRQDSCKFCSA